LRCPLFELSEAAKILPASHDLSKSPSEVKGTRSTDFPLELLNPLLKFALYHETRQGVDHLYETVAL